MRIKIKDWHNLHNGFYLNLRPGYTALVGPNGAGKSTLLRQLKEYANSKDIPVIYYSNLEDGGHIARQRYLENGSTEDLCTAINSSEGQALWFNFSQIVRKIGDAVRKAKYNKTKLFILLDGLDSGLSINLERELMDLFSLIEKDINLTANRKADSEVYIIAAVNNYELATRYCIDARTGKSITFKDYNDYANFICEYENTHIRPEENTERKRF